MNSLFSYKNAKFEKLIFSHFLQYLLNYLTYRDVQYLILILRRFYFDLLKCNLSVGVTVLKLQSCKVVHFFFVHPLVVGKIHSRNWSLAHWGKVLLDGDTENNLFIPGKDELPNMTRFAKFPVIQ